ncbi:MAG: sulfite exporter TauE/SafE family protein [bacterium]
MTPLLLFSIFTVSILFSMLGLGGGVLYVPLLLQANLPFHSAVATSLAIMLVMSLTAAVIYHSNKLIDWRIFFLLEPVTMLGAYIGSYNSNLFQAKTLQIVFAVIMLLSAALMFFPKTKPPSDKNKKSGFLHREKHGTVYYINLWFGIPISFAAGFVSSIIGIGGGFAKVPLMTLIFGVPIKVAVATSSAMIVLTALTGVTGHALSGHIDWKLCLILSVVVFFGALIGSKLSVKVDRKFLDRFFAGVQVLVALWMLIK